MNKQVIDWPFAPGEQMKRSDVHAVFGGQEQSGIVTPANSPYILIFSDPKHGAKYGYDLHEGLREDGSFAYTGQGREGNQVFLRGNKAILNSVENGKSIRLFIANGTLVTYVGCFALADVPFEIRKAPDTNGVERDIIVFNLLPEEANESPLPEYGISEKVKELQYSPWKNLNWNDYLVMREHKEGEGKATRVEFKIQNDFADWLAAKGHEVIDLKIPVGSTTIQPDLFDATTKTLIEAKRSSSRGHVRTAIGQVLDYVHNAKALELDATPAILLPGKPPQDLIDLCKSLGIQLFIAEKNDFLVI